MKKTILAALAALALTAAVHAGDSPEKQLWAHYGAVKAEAKLALNALESGSSDVTVLEDALTGFTAASITAGTLDRMDIVAWMLNNRAYAAITWFKNSGYTAQMERLAKMPAGKDKPAAIADAKATLKPLFERIEAQATADLAAADEASNGEDLTAAVKSNKAFLVWVARFLED